MERKDWGNEEKNLEKKISSRKRKRENGRRIQTKKELKYKQGEKRKSYHKIRLILIEQEKERKKRKMRKRIREKEEWKETSKRGNPYLPI